LDFVQAFVDAGDQKLPTDGAAQILDGRLPTVVSPEIDDQVQPEKSQDGYE